MSVLAEFGAVAFAVLGVLWLVLEILPLSWWRAANVRKRVLYRVRWGRWCDHVQDHGGEAWTEWRVRHDSLDEWRWCRACTVEQRRPIPGAWV